jgi:hypothetical protein
MNDIISRRASERVRCVTDLGRSVTGIRSLTVAAL